jgi:hypothetical protein
MTYLVKRCAIPGATLAVVLVASTGATAAGQCKGMAETACLAQTQCSWVDGYTRKDGRAVSAHCKSKPSKKADKLSPADPAIGKAD